MAERRMFAKTIIDSDVFLDMPMSAQALYFHLSMRADDDGFINNPKRIQRMIGASEDDLKILVAKSFLIIFESGVVVIKHWKIHNYIRSDRYKPTTYEDEKALLVEKDNKAYSLGMSNGIPNGHQMDTQDRLGKDRLGKDRLGKDRLGEMQEGGKPHKSKAKRFTPPTLEEVSTYCQERNNNIDPQHFIDYYTSNGWQVGKTKMKDWKAAIRTWEKNGYSNSKNKVAENLENTYNVLSQWAKGVQE